MITCPVCDCQIDREIVGRCPECGTTFCTECHLITSDDSQYPRCANPKCRYFAKMVCNGCLIEERSLGLLGIAIGGGLGLAAAGIWIGASDMFSARTLWVAIAIVGISLFLGWLGAEKNIRRCPRCRVNIRRRF